ncbi:MAG: hypothetical protein B6229_04525 [Spirochaetaceae bacterium 4572_7]|nr:MAG: hypothetical protein B6229_04525 [Spirochaetaceae bacterium 4572_7]
MEQAKVKIKVLILEQVRVTLEVTHQIQLLVVRLRERVMVKVIAIQLGEQKGHLFQIPGVNLQAKMNQVQKLKAIIYL